MSAAVEEYAYPIGPSMRGRIDGLRTAISHYDLTPDVDGEHASGMDVSGPLNEGFACPRWLAITDRGGDYDTSYGYLCDSFAEARDQAVQHAGDSIASEWPRLIVDLDGDPTRPLFPQWQSLCWG